MSERIEKLKEFIKNAPGDSFLQHALALELIKLGNDAEAGQVFKQILEREPGYVGSYYHYAALLVRAGQNEEAIKVYEKGLAEAKTAGDQHAYNELQAAYEDLVY